MKTPPALSELMGVQPKAKRPTVEETKSVFAAMREASAGVTGVGG